MREMLMEKYLERITVLSEEKYRDFSASLIPGIPKERILGVRIPKIRGLARSMTKEESEAFISDLPHYYLEEYHLHSAIISDIKDYDRCIFQVDKLLPFVDNWSVCDSLRPSVFKKNGQRLLSDIDRWLSSDALYTKRFAVEMLMIHFLGEDFSKEILDRAASVKCEGYYLDMMVAWFFATALAKRWEETLPYIEDRSLEAWTHNKTISKALDSFRISKEHKEILRGLKIR